MTTIAVNQAALKQLAPFMSKEDTRYYLKGVNFMPNGCLAATDGHRLGFVAGATSPQEQGHIMPREAVEWAVKVKPKSKGQEVLLVWDIALGMITAMTKTDNPFEPILYGTFPAKPIDGTFPDVLRVLPEIKEGAGSMPLSFNADFLADFAKPGDKTHCVRVIHTGDESAPFYVLNSSPDFVGVLMPLAARGLNPALDSLNGLLERIKR